MNNPWHDLPNRPPFVLPEDEAAMQDYNNRASKKYKMEPRFVTRMRDNLIHRPSDYPFVFFAPDIDPSHQTWWNSKLKKLLHFGTQVLAHSFFSVHYFPYPSEEFDTEGIDLPSQIYSFDLVKKAITRKAIIVLMRGKSRWLKKVSQLASYEWLCPVRNPQAASISPGNCDKFQDVEQAIKMRMVQLPGGT